MAQRIENIDNDKKSFWSINFAVFVSLLNGVTVICLGAGLFLMAYLNLPFTEFLSATPNDKPFVRDAADVASKAFGIHYFGDFVQTQDWSVMANPWTEDASFLAQYPSVPVYLLKLISWMPYSASLFTYLALMLCASIAAIWLATPKLQTSSRISLAASLGLVSTPILMAFDRGNNVGFIGALFALFAVAVLNGKRNIAALAFALLVAIKIYPVVLVVVFVRKKWIKQGLLALAATGAVTLLLFAITPGDPLQTVTQFITANTKGLTIHGQESQSLINDILTGFNLVDTSNGEFANIVLAVWANIRLLCLAITVVLIVWHTKLSDIEALLLAGYSMMFVYSAALSYNWTWAPAFLAIAINACVAEYGTSANWSKLFKEKPALAFNLVGLALIILPAGWVFPNTQSSVTPYLAWGTGVLTLLIVVVSLASKAVKRLAQRNVA
jgi:Glycosyltransferase family 87